MADEFWIQGADGQEYGPVTLATVEEWVREGRVTPATPVRTASLPPVAARLVPALLHLFPPEAPPAESASVVPAPPPATALAAATVEPARIPAEFKAMAFFEEAWRLLKLEDYLLLSVQLLIMGLIQAVPYVGGCIMIVIGGPLFVGFWRSLLGRIDGRKVDVGVLFSGFDRFADALLFHLVGGLLIALGVLLCIVPGVFLALFWVFSYPVIAETRLGFWEAMQRSMKMGEGRRVEIFVMLLLNIPIVLVGLLACCIGALPAAVLCNTALALAYRHLQQQESAQVFA